ncbi:hypothetical protein DFJ74DRAFT_676176 [Hyaloraphidium curvatum]|nr:hypothetical protein DFJ74DRAFT_676176 [Hyaloraphidium curvatum]
MGSCDNRIDDNSWTVAMNAAQYTGCGRCVEIRDLERGGTVRVTVGDRCAGCGYGSIDLTPAVLRAFGRNTGNWGDAEFPIQWRYC